MKIYFIYPKFEKFLESHLQLAEFPQIASTWAYTMPPSLAIPILINLLPPGVEWEVSDQNIESVDLNSDADLIVVSFFTPQAAAAYRLGDEFLKRGKPVIMGGMHPSMLPGDVKPHCTSVCIGEAETLFPRIINDFMNNSIQPVYKAGEYPPGPAIMSPGNDVFNIREKYDWHAALVSLSRGCSFSCSWCNIPLYQGNKIRFRPLDTVVEDIRRLQGRQFYITDDLVMLPRKSVQEYMLQLCSRIRGFNVSMFLSSSPAMNNDPRFLDALAGAGTENIYVVFADDPISARFYSGHSGIRERTRLLVEAVEKRGIRFFASFGLGFDSADTSQFELILEFCRESGIKTAEFFIATPFPNTPFWKTVAQEERFLLPRDWNKYNCAHVVFRPRNMSPRDLEEGFLYLWKAYADSTDHYQSLVKFKLKAENILKSREYSRTVKKAVKKGLNNYRL